MSQLSPEVRSALLAGIRGAQAASPHMAPRWCRAHWTYLALREIYDEVKSSFGEDERGSLGHVLDAALDHDTRMHDPAYGLAAEETPPVRESAERPAPAEIVGGSSHPENRSWRERIAFPDPDEPIVIPLWLAVELRVVTGALGGQLHDGGAEGPNAEKLQFALGALMENFGGRPDGPSATEWPSSWAALTEQVQFLHDRTVEALPKG